MKMMNDPVLKNLVFSKRGRSFSFITTSGCRQGGPESSPLYTTQLAWSNCYDLGLIFVYCGEKSKAWSDVCVAIRRIIKVAGLDYMTDNRNVYKVSLKMNVICIAKKQILQAGLKFLDPLEIAESNFRIQRTENDKHMPFWFAFLNEFNSLTLELRKFLIIKHERLEPRSTDLYYHWDQEGRFLYTRRRSCFIDSI